MAEQAGFFDAEERLHWLSASGDPLERLRAVVDFEAFQAELEAALPRADRSRGGRPPYDAVLMFRVLVLQALYTLSDEQTEYQLRDRLSFIRFAGLALHDAVPDAKTIWLYREQLTRAGALARLFARFDAMLAERGFLAMGGQIVDATVVEARRPRLTKDEKATLRDGGTPPGWSKARSRQIDRDGRWTIKRGRKATPPEGGAQRQATAKIAMPVFGYKNVWPAPSARGLAILPYQSTPTYPVSGPSPGQDGDPCVPVLITMTASSASSCNRFSERRSTVRPSRFHRKRRFRTLVAAA